MEIYSEEKSIAHLIEKASVAYCTQLVEAEIPNDDFLVEVRKAFANVLIEQKDLYPLTSILVTTGLNKNKDYFDPHETWAARNTPQHKPFNLGHNEKEIIGHMIGNYVIDAQNKIISNDMDINQLPSKFHIVTPSVLYKHWEDPVLKARTSELIKKIKANELFVSMEALFNGFDYILIASDNSAKIIPRNADTAFLTKHLQCYGGCGVYKNYTIGRVLRGITFCGKGLVSNPANPESIIFASDTSDPKITSSSIFIIEKQEKVMADNNEFYEKQIAYAQAQNLELTKDKTNLAIANKELETKLDAANVKVADLEKKLAEAESKIKSANDSIVAKQAEVDAAKKDKEESDEMYKKEKSKSEAVTAELEKMKASVKLSERISYVTSTLSKSEADAKTFVEKFAALADDQFKATIDEIKAAAPVAKGAAEQAEDILDSIAPKDELPMNSKAGAGDDDANKLGDLLAEVMGKSIASMNNVNNRRDSNK